MATCPVQVYKPRRPQDTALYSVIQDNLETWLAARRDVLARPAARVPGTVGVDDPTGPHRRPKFPHHLDPVYPTGTFLPDVLRGRVYYRPGDEGFEQVLAERLAALEREPQG